MHRGTWACRTEAFPEIILWSDTDLTRADGIIVCKEVTTAELIRFGWRAVNALRILLRVPWEI